VTPEEVKSFLKNSHELGIQRNRIIKRLERASLSGLKRFADAIEVLSDEELDGIALECERMALRNCGSMQPDYEAEINESV
jgi:hypothetical protein